MSTAAAAHPSELPADRLRWRCDSEQLDALSTEAIEPLAALVGQDRGVAAIEFAVEVQARCYNLYVAGPSGTGRATAVRDRVERAAAAQPTPPDWCYVHNFADPYRPIAIELPPGRGPELARDVEQLVASCRREVPRVFESEQYQRRRTALTQALDEQRERLLAGLRETAEQLGFAVQLTPMGVVSVPLLAPGQPLSREGFELLPDERKAAIRAAGQQLQGRTDEFLVAMRRLEREAHEQLDALDREAALFAVGHFLDALRSRYAEHPRVVQHLDAVQADLLEQLDEFRGGEAAAAGPPGVPFASGRPAYERYRVNVLVTREPGSGAPVVFEPNPTYQNLVGRVDYHAVLGAMVTDFTLLKPGALHRANGGFLVLQVRDLLASPFAWEALKRGLRDGEVRVENPGDQLGVLPTASLKAEPIPLDVKVVLVGDPLTHMLLHRLDEQFPKLFRVKAQFSPVMDRTPETIRAYAAFVSRQVHDEGLLPFEAEAVARLVEEGARLAEHQQRLSARFNLIAQLVVEADAWARRAGAERVQAAHVDEALAQQEYRANLVEDETRRLVEEGTIAIDTRAAVVGQINGLSVIDLGDYVFARPSRITARTAIGSDGVVNLEREVQLSGPSHSKGVLILGGYLLGAYGRERPLALSASLAFEQCYDEVDGDSASSAELYALLSSLAELPIWQGIAVTGAVNQRGEVQAVGGVTRKIEGFFSICRAQGLSGEQGVIIPATNVRHLMLRREVTEAVERGEFHVWAVQTVDEGIELLTGVPAGARGPDGSYPEASVHGRVERRLAAFAARLAELADGRALGLAARRDTTGSGAGRRRPRGGRP